MKISAVILAKNEEKNIERCLRSLDFCDEIIIIDDYSTDNTLKEIINIKSQITNKSKIQIFENKLNNDFAAQRNFGLSRAGNEWVLFVDADEIVTKDLISEINMIFKDPEDYNGDAYYLKRRDFFWNKELRFGEVSKAGKLGIIRLVKKNSGTWVGRVHEVFKTSRNNIAQLNGYLGHYPHQTLKEFIEDINRYSSLRAEELYSAGKKTNAFEIILFPFGKFIYNYFIKLGFLDGPAGFTYIFMMSFHSFLVRAKLYQQTHK